MKTTMKRLFSLFLVLVMLGSMLPAVYADAQPQQPVTLTDEDYAIADDVFAQIDAMENEPAKKSATEAQLADAAANIVAASDSYVAGSLERNGNSFTWWTEEGIRCVYSPRMREIESNMVAPENPLADGAYNEPVATKGGWPSSNQVYLIAPYYGYDDTFTDQYKNEATSIASAIGDTDGYTLYSGKAATIDTVAEAMSNGAVVIFDSHGNTDYENGNDYVSGANYSYLCMKSTSGLTTEDYNDGALYYSDGIWITGASIANHMTKQSPAGLLWMAICLGMATDTFAVPMREMGVEVVYGYSQSVTFAGDYLYEETFWDNMIAGKDVATSIAAMKSKWGNWDWSTQIATYYDYTDGYSTISAARSDYAAFPIVVSDEDTHPGQRKGTSNYGADSLQTVKSTYTLYSQYNVTAQSNNTAWGTVSVNGSTITATPATGYFAQGYTVTSGSATVTQDGNTFSVMANSDCTVQINFAAKTAVTVNFSGANVSGQTGYAGDSMNLPTAEAPEGYKFLGWTTAPLSADTTEKPEYYTDSFIPTGNITLYALYSYVDENSGSGTGDYVKVTESRDDWSGEYVIVYENDGYIFDGSRDSFDAVSNYQAVTITDNTIAAAEADPYKFTIAAVSGGYSIQGTSGGYVGHGSDANGLTTSASALVNTISLDASGNANIIGDGGAYLRYNATSGQYRFRYYKSSSYTNQKPIALYIKDGSAGTTYYTSSLCDHENTTQVAAVAATCTEIGYTAGVQCTDCGSFVSGHEVVEALGHSYGEWTVTTAPGCETAGEQTSTCSVCGETETQTVAATGHTMDAGSITTAATCTTAGVKTYTCTVCGKTTTESIPATGHTYVDGACSACGEAEPEISKDRFYIAALRNDVYFYMTSDLGTASTKRYQAVDTNMSELPETITNPETGYVFVLIDNGDGTYSLQAEGVEGNNYLGWTSGNSGTLVDEANALKLTVDIANGIYNIHFAASDAERYLALNGTAGNNYFAWYKSGQKQDLVLIPIGGSYEPEVTEPEVTEPEVTEPEVTEPEVTEPEATQPAGSATTLQYVFSDYTAGTQYAQGESHTLDDVVTLTINGAHLNTQIRLYAGSNAVFTSAKEIDSIIVKAGYKANTLNIYSSADGVTWNLVAAQTTTTTYTNYSFDIPDGSYYVKLESVGAQIRVSEMSITVLEAGSTEPEETEPEITEPEVTEPEVTEPEVTEPEVTQPVAGAEVTIDFSNTEQRVSFDASSQVWANNGATLTNNKANASSDVADYSNPVRFYKSSEVIIAFPGMNKIEFNCNTAGYAADLAASITDSNATVTQSGQKVTVEFTNAVDEISFTLAAQVRVNNLTVYREATCQHEYAATVTAPTCTAAGYTTYTCSACGDSYTADEVAALGHSYVLEGTTYTCSVCGDSYDIFYVSFSVPAGVATVEKIEYTEGGITLPSAGAPEGYTFIGWAETAVDNSTDKPAFYAAGSSYVANEAITLQAVYSYVVASGNGDNYVKVTEAPADWSGEYLIVYDLGDGTGYVYNGSLDSQDTLSKANNYVVLNINNNTISAADGDAYRVIVAASGDVYTMQSLSGFYIGRTASTNGLNASTDTVYTNTFSLDSFGHALICCEGGTYLKFNATTAGSYMFRYYATGQKSVDLYVKAGGTTYYTTVIAEEANPVESWNISLGDNIAVNFVMDTEEADEVTFTVAGNAVEAVQNGNTYTIELAAAQMNDQIVISINGVAVEEVYSVRKYADVILAGEYDEAMKNLVKAMLCYGGAAQTFFDYNASNLASDGIEYAAVAPTGNASVAVTDNLAGLDFYGASLVHENKTAVRFYFSGSIEGLTFSQGTIQQKGDMYYIEVAGINPQQLGDTIEIVATDAEGNTLTVGYSPLTYIVRMYEKETTSENTKALVQAMYNYYLAANAYING